MLYPYHLFFVLVYGSLHIYVLFELFGWLRSLNGKVCIVYIVSLIYVYVFIVVVYILLLYGYCYMYIVLCYVKEVVSYII